jgi:hypothetical protein
MRTIIDVISNANGDMTLLDDVDDRIVEELHKLAKVSVATWAQHRETATDREARRDPDLNFARKKPRATPGRAAR